MLRSPIGSNYTDKVRNLWIILIAAHKNYVLDAPLGDRPIAGADADVMKVWQSSVWWLIDSLVHHALRLRTGTSKTFERHGAYEMFQEIKLVFQSHARVKRYEASDKYFSYKMEENSSANDHVLRMSGYTIAWIKWEIIFQIR